MRPRLFRRSRELNPAGTLAPPHSLHRPRVCSLKQVHTRLPECLGALQHPGMDFVPGERSEGSR